MGVMSMTLKYIPSFTVLIKGKKMNKLFTGLIISLAASAMYAPLSFAAEKGDKAHYDAIVERADAQYKTAKDNCKDLKDNAKDVCEKEVKLEQTRTKAEAKAHYEGTVKANSNAMKDIAGAEYDLAKEKCDDLDGNAKDVCVKEAKADKKKAEADAKANKKIAEKRADAAEARQDAQEDKMDADYKVDKEKCDALSGDQKDACQDAAKKKYGK